MFRFHVNPISHISHVVHFAQTMMIQVATMISLGRSMSAPQ
jgi:hypothetical protein